MIASACKKAETLLRVPLSAGPSAAPIRFSQASRWPELRGAFSLLYQNYLAKGLLRPDPLGLRYTHYNLLPESATFVAATPARTLATFSLIPDTRSFGLPMDALYRKELDRLRTGTRPAEISGLAVAPSYESVSLLLILNLVRLMYHYAGKIGVTDLVVACHPRHARLYTRLFGFEQMGPLRTYRAVNDAPAVALRLCLADAEERYRAEYGAGEGLHGFFFRQLVAPPLEPLRAGAMDPAAARQLLALRPDLVEALEAGDPGLVGRLTGWHLPTARRFLPEPPTGWMPAFVAA